MEHINVELVKNDDVAYVAIGNTENYITPESFAALAQEVASLAARNGCVHLTLQASERTIAFEEEPDVEGI